MSEQAISRAADAVAEALGDAYDCLRVWSAWSVGTMSQDDFHRVGDDSERVHDIASAALGAVTLAPEWQTGAPPMPEGCKREFILAVRRKSANGRVFVFAATYANKYDDDMTTRDGEQFIADGWFHTGIDMSGDFNSVYEAITMNEGDEIVGWQPLPKWIEQ